MNKSKALAWAKLLLGASLIIVLVSSVNIAILIERFRSIDIALLGVVLLLPHIAMLFSTIKWQMLLNALNIHVELPRLFNLYMIGTFFSNFLPTMVGGDVIKTYTLYRETGDASSVLAATFLERFMGLTALVSLLPLIVFQKSIVATFPLLDLVVIVITVSYLLLLILLVSPILRYLETWEPRVRVVGKAWNFIRRTHSNIQRFGTLKGLLFSSYVISLIFYFVTVATTWTAARSLGVNIDAFYLLAIVPVVLLAAAIPISLNGLGVTEAGYVLFFQLVGVSAEDSLAIALLLRMRLIVTALLGGLIFMWYRSGTNQIVVPNRDNEKYEPDTNP